MQMTNYITKSESLPRQNIAVQNVWPVGIDYGFSGVKGLAPNKAFCFPNCAVKVDSFDAVLEPSETDILLRDSDGCWVIGSKAHELMSAQNAMNYEDEMYGRNRYFSPVFRALMKAGLGIALTSNYVRPYKGETVIVQTGLPPKYREMDTEMMVEALEGDYDFEMKLGTGQFLSYRFSIAEENIYVMDQPMGSLFSAITMPDGSFSQEGRSVLKSNTVVFDPGFKTLDIYDISGGMFKGSNTFDTLGMYEVFKRTADYANDRYKANMTVAGMQGALRKGSFTAFDRRTLSSRAIDFSGILEKNTMGVCGEAVDKLLGLYNYLQDYEYLIVTGGTGDAWMPYIIDKFKGMASLQILSANKNDPSLSNTYSNVRGYYYYLVKSLAGSGRNRQ